MADHFVATSAGHCSLGLVPPTVPIPALGWEFSQNIEARSQLKNLEGEYLEVAMDPISPKVL